MVPNATIKIVLNLVERVQARPNATAMVRTHTNWPKHSATWMSGCATVDTYRMPGTGRR